jgi:hypothetical protein
VNVDSDNSIPQPTSARLELASVEAVRALGLDMGLDEARLVHVALSGVIASGRSKSREKVAQMNRGVVACCRVEGMRDGELVAAAHPELSEFGWPSGQTAFRKLGIDHRVPGEVLAAGAAAFDRRLSAACLGARLRARAALARGADRDPLGSG